MLATAEPRAKAMAARAAARDWRLGRLAHVYDVPMPDRPARPALPELLPPARMPKRGRGSAHGNIALIHAIAHIEFSAIDLAFDIAGRFGGQFPRAFMDDWLHVGADEAMHFALVDRRLKSVGSFYGAMPAHDGLWDAAADTAHDALARLAIVPMVLEARGLDVTPAMILRFEAAGDSATARILSRIFNDEIRHVRAGSEWFESACNAAGRSVAETWPALVKRHFRGAIRPPFNDSARQSAGLSRDLYHALADD
ncbi:MAG: ferritin-like domain-containing protein [Sphingomonadales bacterium]|nr:MAG: ferritin-like domain-containing protein [Sphingomonadales bacterium]